MADMSMYQKSMDERRKNMSVEERALAAQEQIADMLWGIHMEMNQINRAIRDLAKAR